MKHILTDTEVRVLGALIEKEIATPDNYPLSLNALTAACNQSSNRHPVVHYDEGEVGDAVESLREKGFVHLVDRGESRVRKQRHVLYEALNLGRPSIAVLCVLMLRGPQTPGELRSRTERMCGPMTLPEIEKCLEELTSGGDPLIRVIPARPGQKENRYVQLLSGEPDLETLTAATVTASAAASEKSRLDTLEAELEALKSEFRALRDELGDFKKLFG